MTHFHFHSSIHCHGHFQLFKTLHLLQIFSIQTHSQPNLSFNPAKPSNLAFTHIYSWLPPFKHSKLSQKLLQCLTQICCQCCIISKQQMTYFSGHLIPLQTAYLPLSPRLLHILLSPAHVKTKYTAMVTSNTPA